METKWTTQRGDVGHLAQQHVQQARWGAGRISLLLRSQKLPGIQVLPVIVVWGPHVTGARSATIDGVLALRAPAHPGMRAELLAYVGLHEGFADGERALVLDALGSFSARQQRHVEQQLGAAERWRRRHALRKWSRASRLRRWRFRHV